MMSARLRVILSRRELLLLIVLLPVAFQIYQKQNTVRMIPLERVVSFDEGQTSARRVDPKNNTDYGSSPAHDERKKAATSPEGRRPKGGVDEGTESESSFGDDPTQNLTERRTANPTSQPTQKNPTEHPTANPNDIMIHSSGTSSSSSFSFSTNNKLVAIETPPMVQFTKRGAACRPASPSPRLMKSWDVPRGNVSSGFDYVTVDYDELYRSIAVDEYYNRPNTTARAGMNDPTLVKAAVCKIEPFFTAKLVHFPHAMQVITKCFDYWVEHSSPENYPNVLLYDDETQGEPLKQGFKSNTFMNGTHKMLTEQFNVTFMSTKEYYSSEFYHPKQTVRTFKKPGLDGYVLRHPKEWNELLDRYLLQRSGGGTTMAASTTVHRKSAF